MNLRSYLDGTDNPRAWCTWGGLLWLVLSWYQHLFAAGIVTGAMFMAAMQPTRRSGGK